MYTSRPSDGDRDGDGVADEDDLCPSIFDPVRPLDGASQPDADGDGVGDACDPCPFEAGDACARPSGDDIDGDGVPNAADTCPEIADPDQADRDGDGKGDACDPCPDFRTRGTGAAGDEARRSDVLASLAIGAFALPAGADEPTPVDSAVPAEVQDQARLHFTAGVNLLQDPGGARYEEAYVEFKRAYELVRSYKILGNIALCAMKLERDAEALDAYTRYLAEAQDLDPEERAQAERDIVNLRAGLAKVHVESRSGGLILHDRRITGRGDVLNVYGPLTGRTELGVRRGHHVFTARFPDGAEVVWELDVQGGESHVFEKAAQPTAAPAPEPPPVDAGLSRSSRPVPASVYIAGAATGVLAIGALTTGVLAVDTHARFDRANDGLDPERASDLRSTGRTLNVVSDVLIAGTVVAAAATAYFYLTRPTVAPKERAGVFVHPFGVYGRF